MSRGQALVSEVQVEDYDERGLPVSLHVRVPAADTDVEIVLTSFHVPPPSHFPCVKAQTLGSRHKRSVPRQRTGFSTTTAGLSRWRTEVGSGESDQEAEQEGGQEDSSGVFGAVERFSRVGENMGASS